MNWAIGQHPNIQVMPETAWIATYVTGAISSYNKGSERGKFSHLSNVEYPAESFLAHVARSVDDIVRDVYETRCRKLYGDYRAQGIHINPENPNAPYQVRRSPDDPKARWIDGTPLNSQFVLALEQVFPEARYIHNLRNPADVALSLENFDKVGAEAQSLGDGLKTWMQHTEYAWLAEKAFGPGKVFRLDFARLEQEPEAAMRDVLAFLGEDWCADCLEPLKNRTNSSDVDHLRPELEKRISRNRVYRKAVKLFDELNAEVDEGSRLEAGDLLKQRFEVHLSERPLL